MSKGFQLKIGNLDLPELGLTIGVPAPKVKEVMENGDAAISLARALLAPFEHMSGTKYYRMSEGSRFVFDADEKDLSLHEIVGDFLMHGEYEPHTTALVKEIVKPGMICLDVGASIGYFTILLAKLAGVSGKVYSIEATKNQFPRLLENINANGLTNVEAHNIAAWGKEDTIHINSNAGQIDNVPAKALDSIFIVNEPVDFIKMDIDGSEPEALKGLEETIKRSPHLKMVIEYYPKYIERLGLNPKDVTDFLDKYFTYEKIEGDLGSKDYWNYICVRK